VQHARPHVFHGPVEHLVMQKPDSQRQEQGRKLWVRTRVKRKLLLNQGGSVFVAASKMHHVEQNGRQFEPHCGVADGMQLLREELDRWAAAAATLQVFTQTPGLGTNTR